MNIEYGGTVIDTRTVFFAIAPLTISARKKQLINRANLLSSTFYASAHLKEVIQLLLPILEVSRLSFSLDFIARKKVLRADQLHSKGMATVFFKVSKSQQPSYPNTQGARWAPSYTLISSLRMYFFNSGFAPEFSAFQYPTVIWICPSPVNDDGAARIPCVHHLLCFLSAGFVVLSCTT